MIYFFFYRYGAHRDLNVLTHSFPTRRSSDLRQYAGASAALVVIVTLFLLLRGFSPLLAILLGLFVGLGLPHKVIGFLINKRITRFTVNFPDALELLVRGLRSRSEEHTSELQSLMRISYAVFCLKKKIKNHRER